MKNYLIGITLAAVLAVGATVVALASDNGTPADPSLSSSQLAAPDIASIDGDDIRDDRGLGDQGETEDVPGNDAPLELEADEDVDVDTSGPLPDRSTVLADLRDFIEGRSENLGEALVELVDQRAAGSEVAAGVETLVDDITVFGEAVITGVAISPDTLAAVPDLREIHQNLISGVEELHTAASSLNPSVSDATWNAAVAGVINALGSVTTILT